MGVSEPLGYLLAPHQLQHLSVRSGTYCDDENNTARGDGRTRLIVSRAPRPPLPAIRVRLTALFAELREQWRRRLDSQSARRQCPVSYL
jgi:hypothetical protein